MENVDTNVRVQRVNDSGKKDKPAGKYRKKKVG